MATIDKKRKQRQFSTTPECIDSADEEEPIIQPPPYIIVVHGPPKVGKSLLIKSLIKHYPNHIPTDDGPLTIVLPERRIQFVECPNNVNGMIDAAKYADAVIFVIDISYGFEMETFEFVNLLKVHGMPKVIGVFTHLDCLINTDVNAQAKVTERFKKDFRKEIYEEAQMFRLSAPEEMYPDRDICELASFISGMEFHSLSWRAAGSYVLVDGLEDATPIERLQMNGDCVRDVILYGYLRGCDFEKNFLKGIEVYIAGVGDFPLDFVTSSAEPRPSLQINVTDPKMQIDITNHSSLDHIDEGTTKLKSNIYRIGSYLMFKVCNVPSEMVNNRKPCQPILIGDIYPRQNQVVGQISARFERHSFHMKSLRTKDPIIVSVGWRRYLTTPTYGRENLDEILEFTPEDEKPCFAELWGPVVTPGTGFVAVQSLADKEAAFRILGTGEVLLFNSKMKPAGGMYLVRAPEPEPRDRVWKDGTEESEKSKAHVVWGSLERKIAPEHLRQSMSKIREDKLELPCQKRKTDEHRRAVMIFERFSYRNSAEFDKAYQKQKEEDIRNNIPRGMAPRYFFKKKEIEQLRKQRLGRKK